MKAAKEKTVEKTNNNNIEDLFSVGAHYAYSRSRRHPSAEPYIFGIKNRVEIFDLEKTEEEITEAESFFEEMGKKRKVILFVGGKNEARKPIKEHASRIGQPYVAGRWVGGMITNFSQINKRVQRLDELEEGKEKGTLDKYTKKERLLMDREVEDLKKNFEGIRNMEGVPCALFVVDIGKEHTAIKEARHKSIPVVAVSNSNCDLSKADISIPCNDSVQKSIDYIVSRLVDAYEEGLKQAVPEKEEKEAGK